MTWVLGTSIVADLTEFQSILNLQHVGNLEADSQWTAETGLEQSSDAVYRWLKARGGVVDPSAITNVSAFKRPVCLHLHADLVRGGYLQPPEGLVAPIDPMEWAEPVLRATEVELSSGEAPPRAGMSRPKARNIDGRSASYF